jgi:hypothetical protein
MTDFITNFEKFPYLYITATYAAVLSSVAIVWDIVKWKATHPRLKIKIEDHSRPAMNIATRRPEENVWKTITITNIGIQTTTLKAVWIVTYQNRFDFKGKKAELKIDNRGNELPFTLESGKQWEGYPRGPEEGILNSPRCFSYIKVTHSMSDKPARLRIKGP